METRCDTVSGELHATFTDNSPGGSHALPLIAPPVAQPLAQPVARQWPGTVNTVAANNLPKPTVTEQGTIHRLATTQPPPTPIFPHQQAEKSPQNQHVWSSNTDFPAPASRKVTTKPTRFAHPPRWSQPPPTPIFPHYHAEKSPQNQHDLPILHVGTHHLQHRLSSTNKPTSHHKTNTLCPLTPKPTRFGL